MNISTRSLLIDRETADQAKESAQRSLIEFSRKIASAIDFHDDYNKSESILKRIFEINDYCYTNKSIFFGKNINYK